MFFLDYRSLVGKPVDAPLQVSQEWNIRIGTGLAFIAKSSWTVAIITSQVQHVWRTVHNKKLPPKVIDAAFLVSTDISFLVRLDLLRHAVVATILAVAAWGIPISAIFTPSTLTVTGYTSSRVVLDAVPAIDFNDYPRWARMTAIVDWPQREKDPGAPRGPPRMRWETYSSQLGLQVTAITSSGRTEQMVPKFVNSTFLMEFNAPSIRCRNTTERRREFKVISGNPYGEVRYIAFIPATNQANETVAWNMTSTRNGNSTVRLSYGLELWMVTNSVVFSKSDEMDYLVKEAHICTMYNSSYTVNATFQNGQQHFNTTVEPIEPVKFQLYMQLQSDIPLVEEDGKNTIPIPVNTNVQHFAYQGIWWLLMEQLVSADLLERTVLIGANEFSGDFQNMDDYNLRGYGGGTQPFKQNKTLVELIEQLSQNITLSLLANPVFL